MSTLKDNQLLVQDVITKGIVRDIRAYNGSLTDAIADIGSDEVTLLISEPITVNQDLTVPENICLKVLKGCPITVGVKAQANEVIGTGSTAGTTSFSTTLSDPPVVWKSVTVSWISGGVSYTATDDGKGNISSPYVSGTIDYDSGAISLTFSTVAVPDAGTNIMCTYTPAHVLTINGAIEAGLWQIFDGQGKVTGNPKIEAVYPEWFGAKGDGMTDDAPAIQKAIDFCAQNQKAKGSCIKLSRNHYRITSNICVKTDNVTIEGEGGGNWQSSDINNFDSAETVIEYTGADYAFVCGDNSGRTFSGICFRGFKLLLTGGGGGINYVRLCHGNCNVENVAFYGNDATPYSGVGIRYGDMCQSNRVINCSFWYLDYGVYLYGLNDNLVFIGNKFIRTGTAGIKLGDSASTYTAGNSFLIIGNHFGKNGKAGVWVFKSPKPVAIIGNYFENSTDLDERAIIVGDTGYTAYSVEIRGNVISGSGISNYGIELINVDGCVIESNAHMAYLAKFILVSGGSDVRNVVVRNNSRFSGSYGDLSAYDGVVEWKPSSTSNTIYLNTLGAIVLAARVTGNSNNNFAVTADGKLEWGDGINPLDIVLYRAATKRLNLIGHLRTEGGAFSSVIQTFVDGDTTPSVANSNVFRTANTSATSIIQFDDGIDGQEITVIFGDSNTTIVHNSTAATYPILLKGGVSITPSTNTAIKFVFSGNRWIEV